MDEVQALTLGGAVMDIRHWRVREDELEAVGYEAAAYVLRTLRSGVEGFIHQPMVSTIKMIEAKLSTVSMLLVEAGYLREDPGFRIRKVSHRDLAFTPSVDVLVLKSDDRNRRFEGGRWLRWSEVIREAR